MPGRLGGSAHETLAARNGRSHVSGSVAVGLFDAAGADRAVRAAGHAGHAGRNRRDGGVRKEAEELLALPRDLGSGLTLQAVLPFSGPNVDADGAESDQLATIIVQNNGGMAVGAADITLTCEDGAELRFRVTDLPVGGSCYAFELNSAQYTGENRVCAASAEVEPDGSLSVDYRVTVMVQDGGLVLVNMTEDTLRNVTVRYRTDTGGTYFGGLSYTATVEELAPGASQTVLAAECYMGLPSVIAVSADES